MLDEKACLNGPDFVRADGRSHVQLRQISSVVDEFGFADGSVLFGLGKTKVLCSVSISDGVPHFLKGKGVGWLTAEYAMLPCSTNKRSMRESSSVSKNSRSVEISRLIGRCLRSVCDLSLIGERTINIDCDVIQADGGTRVCAISGSSFALELAEQKWLKRGLLKRPILKERIAAVSVIAVGNCVILDACQEEDSNASADFNFVFSESKKIIEIQGTGEKAAVEWEKFDQMRVAAQDGVDQIIGFYSNFISKNSF